MEALGDAGDRGGGEELFDAAVPGNGGVAVVGPGAAEVITALEEVGFSGDGGEGNDEVASAADARRAV